MSQNAANFSVGTDNAIARYDTTAGAVLQNSVPTIDDTGNLSISAAVSGASLSATVANTSNTASATAFYNAQVAGSTASDAYYKAEISGGQAYTFGVDNSDSDAFVLSASATLGTTNIMRSSTAGAITFPTSTVGATGGNVNITRSASGADVSLTSSNTSNTASSTATNYLTVAGTSAGDARVQYAVSGTTTWTEGIDNSVTGDPFVISASASLGTSNVMSIATTGEINYPLQPAFLAYVDTTINNVTGDLTSYTIIYDTEVYDVGSDFDLGTSTFTAPVTGKYQFNCFVTLLGGTALSSVQARINTSNNTFRIGMPTSAGVTSSAQGMMSVLADMDAADTMTITVAATDSGGKIDDIGGLISGTIRNWITGQLGV